MIDRWGSKGYFNSNVVSDDYVDDVTSLATNQAAFDFIQNVAIPIASSMNPDVKFGMMLIPSNSENDEPTLISGENVALGILKDTKAKTGAIALLNYLAQPEVSAATVRAATVSAATVSAATVSAATVSAATGNVPALTNVKVDLGSLQTYIDKYANVKAYNYFDRDYCPSGLWDVICAVGQDVLAQKPNAIADTTKTVKENFDALFSN